MVVDLWRARDHEDTGGPVTHSETLHSGVGQGPDLPDPRGVAPELTGRVVEELIYLGHVP